MRKGGKPVVVLLDLDMCVSLLAKEEAKYRQLTGMYKSQQRYLLLF
jgi:hypothetical protein